ncbi:uncharacterized protein F4807DRAFT_241922 [Annulohypoxylon truncatum]|uniref:uncharacterized protein n=1 Tax=Annulohypoxylon truncatum TaxID=327061 RepID=UPI002007F153|nr:uncharacterized protein F4807DRAFT_241922 [Annulohypoxylon truncatum]KAI1206238.1 hypothetical protein F4807DRAFT_241922 [Annulohypoxylon truncatum]
MAGERFKKPISNMDLSSKVRHDPFRKLPHVAICNILHLLTPKGLLDVVRASWTVYFLVRNKHCFWKSALKKTMPWFFEIPELMRVGALRRPEHYRGIYLWAERIWPRKKLTGPLMNIANRRRIWVVCEVLADNYMGCFKPKTSEYEYEDDGEEE